MSSPPAAPRFSSSRCTFVVPGIGTTHGFRDSSHARATCAGVALFRPATRPSSPTNAWLAVRGDDQGDVGEVARPKAPGDGELHRAVQLLLFPDFFEPPDRHLRPTAVRASAAAPLAEYQLGEWTAVGDG